MKKTLLLILISCVSLLIQASVTQTADVTTAGTLYNEVVSYKDNVTDLTVTGSIDARDFVTIRDSMPNLVNLDLSGSNIAAYQGTALSPGSDTYQISGWGYTENMIPYWAFAHEASFTTITGGSTTLKSIILPNTCTWIGYGAFYGCSALSTITLPQSLTIIGGKGFYNCTSLTAISIPSAVTSIRDAAFFNCSALTAITVNNSTPPSISGSNNFYGVNSKCIVYVPTEAVATYQATATWNSLSIRSINNALSFNSGVYNYVEANQATDAIDNVTMEAWVNWSGSTSNYQVIATNGNASYDGYALYIDPSTNAVGILCGGIGWLPSTCVLPVNSWVHLAAVRNNGTWHLYINKVEVPILNNSTTPNTPNGNLFIGCNENMDMFFNGLIDEVRIWNVARTQSQIVSAINIPIAIASSVSNLVVYYDFNSGVANSDNTSISRLTDRSFSQNNGWLFNFDLMGTASNFVPGFDTTNVGTVNAISDFNKTIAAANGSTATVNYYLNSKSWLVSSNQSWLTVSPQSSINGNGTLTFTATENLGATRSDTVILSAIGEISQIIIITQYAGVSYRGDLSALTLSNNMYASVPIIDQESNLVNYFDDGTQDLQYFKFMPTVSATYTFSSFSNSDPAGYVFDASGLQLGWGDDDYGLEFNFSCDLTAGNLYYFGYVNYSGDNAITLKIDGGGLQGFVFTGSDNWNNASNWNWQALPQDRNNVTIQGNVEIGSDVSVTNVTVQPNASVSIDNGVSLKYVNLTLVNDATGSASLISDNNKMPATVEEYIKSGRNWYISSPTTASTSNVVKANASNSLWNYNEPTASWNAIANKSTNLSVMTGYVANNAADGFISFTEGALNTGTQTINLNKTGTDGKSGFNLIGNPYPSSVNWDMADTNNIESSIWFRTQNKSNHYVFDTYNSKSKTGTNNNGNADVTGIIPPLQAVWVRVTEGNTSGSVTFENSMRSNTVSGNVLKSDVVKTNIRLKVANGTNSDETILVFNEKASNGYDGYDSKKQFVNNADIPEIYTTAGSEKVVINGMQSFDASTVIPLGFKTAKKGTFTLSATEIQGIDGFPVVLEDKILNITQDLTKSPIYSFTSDSVDTNRFVIRLKADVTTETTTASTLTNNEKIVVYSNDHQAIVKTASDNCNGLVIIFDLLGNQIAQSEITGTQTTIDVPTVGVYFVKVNTNKASVTKKIIIK